MAIDPTEKIQRTNKAHLGNRIVVLWKYGIYVDFQAAWPSHYKALAIGHNIGVDSVRGRTTLRCHHVVI